ncbi:MAG: hypothetical protein KDC92_14390 [Bacteroidetes bacterium]|nr:hypothetical protein [Bacteroidota bacterium]
MLSSVAHLYPNIWALYFRYGYDLKYFDNWIQCFGFNDILKSRYTITNLFYFDGFEFRGIPPNIKI